MWGRLPSIRRCFKNGCRTPVMEVVNLKCYSILQVPLGNLLDELLPYNCDHTIAVLLIFFVPKLFNEVAFSHTPSYSLLCLDILLCSCFKCFVRLILVIYLLKDL